MSVVAYTIVTMEDKDDRRGENPNAKIYSINKQNENKILGDTEHGESREHEG